MKISERLADRHPRLYVFPGDFVRIKSIISRDDLAKQYFNRLVRHGEEIIKKPVVQRILEGREPHYRYILGNSREILDRVFTLSMLYNLTGQKKWVKKAVLEMLNAADYIDWNPAHFLDTAEMMHALSVGYDWLYDQLTPSQKDRIIGAIRIKGLEEAKKGYSWRAWWTDNNFNWNTVCNSSILIASLAIYEKDPEICEMLIQRAIECIPAAFKSFAPDGAWAEGPGYWGYTMRYGSVGMAALQSVLGDDFSLTRMSGLVDAGEFRMHGVGPTGLFFNFADAAVSSHFDPSLYWLAAQYNRPIYARAAEMSIPFGKFEADYGAAARALLWYRPEMRTAPEYNQFPPTDARYSNTNLAFFRSSWEDPAAVYLGIKGGDNKANHSHIDLGTFVLDALEERWMVDLGPDDYTLPGYWDTQGKRWSYYRLSTPGHNVPVINGLNQDPKAEAALSHFYSSENGSGTIIDLTRAYAPARVQKVIRKLDFYDQKHLILLEDSFELSEISTVECGFHSCAQIRIYGNNVEFSKDNKKVIMAVELPDNGQIFLEDLDVQPPQRSLEGVRKIKLTVPATRKCSIRVKISIQKG